MHQVIPASMVAIGKHSPVGGREGCAIDAGSCIQHSRAPAAAPKSAYGHEAAVCRRAIGLCAGLQAKSAFFGLLQSSSCANRKPRVFHSQQRGEICYHPEVIDQKRCFKS